MIKKITALIFLLLISFFSFAQETMEAVILEVEKDTVSIKKDTIVYKKDINFVTQREFKDNLKEKYSDNEFIYTEELEKEEDKPKTNSSPIDPSFLKAFGSFMSTIFPFLLGGIIIIIILKTFLGSEAGFWNFKKTKKVASKKLVFEDENIHEVDLQELLKKAINTKDYRLAVRYYYLMVLKDLSAKKIIKYHKEKTNTEYLFEIENLSLRNDFSYISYIYSYVWYGDFPIDEDKFKAVEIKYKSFLKSNI